MSGWEDAFERRIGELRSREVAVVRRAGNLRAINEANFFATPTLIAYCTFMVKRFVLDEPLTTQAVFTALGREM